MLASIIMPCHNGKKIIKDSIQSVINQTYKEYLNFNETY